MTKAKAEFRRPKRGPVWGALVRPALVALLCSTCVPRIAAAQVVGSLPDRSPFADLDDGHRIGVETGWLVTGRDPLGVRPHSAPVFGLRYDVLLGGPAYFTSHLFSLVSTHDVLDPNRPSGQRNVGTASANMLGFDANLTLSLVGARTWHRFQPLVGAGIGMIGGVGNKLDLGGYRPTASVLYRLGFGGRYTTGRNSELRADLSWLYFSTRYPETWRTTSAADNIPLRANGSLTPMTGNRALTVGWTWGVFR